jgi:hypothetical protein
LASNECGSLDQYPRSLLTSYTDTLKILIQFPPLTSFSCLSIFALVAGILWVFKSPMVGTLVRVTAILVFTLVGTFTLRQADVTFEGRNLHRLAARSSPAPGYASVQGCGHAGCRC